MIESFEHNGKVVEIDVDEDAQSPREDCYNPDVMVCFHKRMQLGDKTDYKQGDFQSWEEMEDKICKDNDILDILPIYMYDHSGITISTTPFSCPWDSGRVGFIYITKDKARECCMVKRVTKKTKAWARECLLSSVKVYDQFLTNDIYGYTIKDKDTDEVLESCWGFYGLDEVIKESKEIAENIKDKAIKVEENPNQLQLALETA